MSEDHAKGIDKAITWRFCNLLAFFCPTWQIYPAKVRVENMRCQLTGSDRKSVSAPRKSRCQKLNLAMFWSLVPGVMLILLRIATKFSMSIFENVMKLTQKNKKIEIYQRPWEFFAQQQPCSQGGYYDQQCWLAYNSHFSF